jgi:nickel superoxide dismutase
MSLWNHALALLDRLDAPRPARAHCDVPCGIYDPRPAQIAAQTVITLTQKMMALTPPGPDADQHARQSYENTIARMATVRDEHAEKVKHEVTVLWGDYFKPPHVQQFPNLHEHIWMTLKQAGQARQTMDLEAGQKLLTMVDQIADWFYQSKNVEDASRRVEEGHPVL